MQVPKGRENTVRPGTNLALLEEVFTQHRQDLIWFCFRRIGDYQLAEDACGRITLKALNNIDTFTPHPERPGATLRAWLFRIARNDLIDFQRTRKPIQSLDRVDLLGNPIHDPSDRAKGPEETALANEINAQVRRMLSLLPDSQRSIVELRLAGLRGDEIAQTMDLTLSSVKSAQYRAYLRLRELLADNHEVSR